MTMALVPSKQFAKISFCGFEARNLVRAEVFLPTSYGENSEQRWSMATVVNARKWS
jgi:hypothetical protein